MRFSQVVISGAALLSSAFAATIDTYPTGGVQAGQTYTITYSPKDVAATFILRRGLSTNLDTVGTIGTSTMLSFNFHSKLTTTIRYRHWRNLQLDRCQRPR
jgi:hypothetical protein